MCEVVEDNKKVSVSFGDGIKYLGSDYPKQIGLYDKKGRLKFKTAFAVCSYLTECWGWEQCGNPTINGKVKKYSLEHEITFNTNLFRQMELFNQYEKSHKK